MSLQTQYHVDVSHLCDFITSAQQGFYEGRPKTKTWKDKFKNNAVLLVIDPQNSFMEENENVGRLMGSLFVPNSNADIQNVINLVNAGYFHEVHVSLDTHSIRHIAHPGFWTYEDAGKWVDATDAQKFNVLKNMYEEDTNKWYVEGTYLFDDTVKTKFYPKKTVNDTDGSNKFENLCEYVKEYIDTLNEGGGHPAIIWPYHCLESTNGHKVARELQLCLTRVQDDSVSNVFYHNKGRNNLAEMYSIFSAEVPLSMKWLELLHAYAYEKQGIYTSVPDARGSRKYESQSNNICTELNREFLARLFGTNNTIYVCGEARTHCVKASVMDMIKYVKEKNDHIDWLNSNNTNCSNLQKIDMSRIVLLKNSSSPIGDSEEEDAHNSLEAIMRREGCVVMD